MHQMKNKVRNCLIVTAIFLLARPLSYSQEIDSLKLDTLINVLTLQLEDERTVNAYNELSNDYILIADYETAMKYAELGMELSEKIGYKEGNLESTSSAAHIQLAYYLDYSKSVKLYDQAFLLAEELNDQEGKIRVFRGYTSIYAAMGNYDKALEYNAEAIQIAKDLNDEQVVSDLSAYGGNIYEETGDTTKAMEMYKEVVEIETKNNFKNTSKASLVIVAHYYYYLEGDLDKSLKQYRIALRRFERLKDLRWVSYTHSQMAKIYLETDNFERVEMHSLKGYSIAEELNLIKEKMDNASILAELYSIQEKDSLSTHYQIIYDSLYASTITEIESEVTLTANDSDVEETIIKEKSSPWDGLINTLIILGLVGLTVFVSGLKKPVKK